MKLRVVTVTGADSTTPIEALVQLSAEFPFLEFGIVQSPHHPGRAGFPTPEWLDGLAALALPGLRLAAHLCGRYVLDASVGELPPPVARPCFGRIQLNLAGYDHLEIDPTVVIDALHGPREYVLQVGAQARQIIHAARELRRSGTNASLLFDSSGGKGLTPAEWPTPPPDIPCGFAGGLGPDNLAVELRRLASLVGAATIWIDMQRHVRGPGGAGLDLERVRRCLEIAGPYVG